MQQDDQRINIDIGQAEDVPCKKCENLYFLPVVSVKRLSALLSPTGKEVEIPHSEE